MGKKWRIDSKFGLTSTEILEAFELMQENELQDLLTMIHFHIGSAMNTIKPLKKALRDQVIFMLNLKSRCKKLNSINIGGGLSVEYSAYEQSRFYSLAEFASDVVFTLKILQNKRS